MFAAGNIRNLLEGSKARLDAADQSLAGLLLDWDIPATAPVTVLRDEIANASDDVTKALEALDKAVEGH